MVGVYAVALVIGIVALFAWIFLAANASSPNSSQGLFDPEERFGMSGRRVVAALVGFGMGGMSAEFSPLDLAWPVAALLAVAGAGAAVWVAGRDWAGSSDRTD